MAEKVTIYCRYQDFPEMRYFISYIVWGILHSIGKQTYASPDGMVLW